MIVYFDAVPKPKKVEKLEDLDPVIELYHHTIRAGKYTEAEVLYYDRLRTSLYYQFGAYQTIIELLRSLFVNGEDKEPPLDTDDKKAFTLNELANSYSLSGQPRRAVPLFEMQNALQEKAGDKKHLAIGLGNVADDQLKIGALSEAERNLRRAISLSQETGNEENVGSWQYFLGHVFAYCGKWNESEKLLQLAEEVKKKSNHVQAQSVIWAYRALRFLLMARETVDSNQLSVDSVKSAIQSAQRALELADEQARTSTPNELNYVEAHWLLGAAYRANGDLEKAEFHLNESISRCRKINLVMDEADILLDLSKLRHAQGDSAEALRLAQEASFITERSGYVLQGADVNLWLAEFTLAEIREKRIESSKGKEQARKYAESALKLAECEGGDYKYKVAYDEAVALLERLKV
ncbi:MAG: tetratricopeptide repeat protein [Chloroflexota bacterium]